MMNRKVVEARAGLREFPAGAGRKCLTLSNLSTKFCGVAGHLSNPLGAAQ